MPMRDANAGSEVGLSVLSEAMQEGPARSLSFNGMMFNIGPLLLMAILPISTPDQGAMTQEPGRNTAAGMFEGKDSKRSQGVMRVRR